MVHRFVILGGRKPRVFVADLQGFCYDGAIDTCWAVWCFCGVAILMTACEARWVFQSCLSSNLRNPGPEWAGQSLEGESGISCF